LNQTSSAIIKTKLFEETQLGLKRLEALHEIDRIITSSVELSFAIKQIMKIVVTQLDIDAANVLIYDPNSLMFIPENAVGFHNKSLYQKNHQPGNGFASRVALERKIVRVEGQDEFNNQFGDTSTLTQEGFSTCIGIPLIVKGEIKGVLEIFHRSPLQIDNEWEGFLQTLATQLAIAIDNSQMFENLQKSHLELTLSYDATIEGWAKTLELRDQETQGHSERVTSMSVKLARALGMSEEELIHIRRGSILHDVGKIGIPDKILQKPGQLTEDEMAVMREHPTLAYNVLSGSVFLKKALDIPYSHHEKWDGSGYPKGIKAEEIPLAARVFAIIDVYDALRSDRPYRKAWSKGRALKHIKEQSGSHFDPRVVEIFLELVDTDPGFNVYDE
jgi:HD-GYP domain-containing protein (c-di-GMP phosphodiesterase class II)